MTAATAQAARLAGAGHYDEAEQMLHEAGGREGADPDVLDLQARIHAQRGEFAAADDCWARAQRAGGDAAAARAGRRRLAVLQARRARKHPVRAGLALVAAAAIGAGGIAVIQHYPVPGAELSTRLDVLRGEQQRLSGQVGAVADRFDRAVADRDATLRGLGAALAAEPALRAYPSADALAVTFPGGMFSVGTELAGNGETALDRFASVLPAFADRVTVTVTGHTEAATVSPTLGYTDAAELGLARARTVAAHLAVATGLPLSMFLLASAGATAPPFPDGTDAGPQANRTVTVTLRPR